MSWEIKLDSTIVDYELEDQQYQTYDIKLVNTKSYTEKGAGYQEPDDIVIEAIYEADSEHGLFKWTVIARSTGFNTYADDIEDVHEILIPEGCEIIESPSFSIRLLDNSST